METLKKYKLKSLFLIVCLSIPTLIFGVEVCKIPSGCQIDEKGICIDCVEQEFEEETEEDKSERKIAQYNSSYTSPMLQLSITNITFNFGMRF